MCSCGGRVCVGMARGVSRGGKAPHACRCGPPEPPRAPRPRARGNPLCVCAPHSPAQAVECVCAARGGRGRGEPGARHCTDRRWTTACAVPHRYACVCVRWTGLVVVVHAPLEMRVAAQVCAGGGLQPRGQPRGHCGMNWPVRGRRPSTDAVGWRRMAFFWCAPALRGSPHTPRRIHTSLSRSALVAPRARCVRVGERWPLRRPAARSREERAAPHPLTTCHLLLHTTHAVHRPPVGGQAPSFHTVRRTCWCSSTRHRHHGGGPASCEAAQTHRDVRGGPRRRGHERRRLPRERVLHTMCPIQRRNKGLADEPLRALGRAEPRAKGGVRRPPHPRPPRRAHQPRARASHRRANPTYTNFV